MQLGQQLATDASSGLALHLAERQRQRLALAQAGLGDELGEPCILRAVKQVDKTRQLILGEEAGLVALRAAWGRCGRARSEIRPAFASLVKGPRPAQP